MNRLGLHFRLTAGIFAALLLLGACGGGSDDGGEESSGGDAASEESEDASAGTGECGGSGGESVDLEAADFQFDPSEISAPAGEQVTVSFTNKDDAPHTFTITDMSCDTGSVAAGASSDLSFTMPEAETEFICNIHPDMKGTLVPE